VVREDLPVRSAARSALAGAVLAEADAVAAALAGEDGRVAVDFHVEEQRWKLAVAEELAELDRGDRPASETEGPRPAAGGARRHLDGLDPGVHGLGDDRELDRPRPGPLVVVGLAPDVRRHPGREIERGFGALAAAAAARRKVGRDRRRAPGQHFAFRLPRGPLRAGVARTFVYLA